jgi:hypothetical protein
VFHLWRSASTPEAAEAYAALRATIREHFTAAFGQRFIARCIRFSKITLGNIPTYRKALTNQGHDPRTADRLAGALAGARSLTGAAGVAITDAEAEEEIKNTAFGDFVNPDPAQYAEGRDERAFWDHLISQRITIDRVDFTLGELIDDLRGKPLEFEIVKRDALARYGIRFNDSSTQLYIARGKKVFAELLQGTKWENNYYLHLNRLLEASDLDPEQYTTQLRFRGLGRAYTTILPAEVLDTLFGGTMAESVLRECIDLGIEFTVAEDGKGFEAAGDIPARLENGIKQHRGRILEILKEQLKK